MLRDLLAQAPPVQQIRSVTAVGGMIWMNCHWRAVGCREANLVFTSIYNIVYSSECESRIAVWDKATAVSKGS